MNEKDEKARPPIKHELGGGYYYTCYWLKCSEQLQRWWRYCPICGTPIRWEDDSKGNRNKGFR